MLQILSLPFGASAASVSVEVSINASLRCRGVWLNYTNGRALYRCAQATLSELQTRTIMLSLRLPPLKLPLLHRGDVFQPTRARCCFHHCIRSQSWPTQCQNL